MVIKKFTYTASRYIKIVYNKFFDITCNENTLKHCKMLLPVNCSKFANKAAWYSENKDICLKPGVVTKINNILHCQR